MTREEIMALDMEALEQRAGEIAEETREASAETLDSFTAELDAIEERKNIIKAEAVEKRAKIEAVASGMGEVIEEPIQERKTMTNKEYRSSQEYIDAYVEYVKRVTTSTR